MSADSVNHKPSQYTTGALFLFSTRCKWSTKITVLRPVSVQLTTVDLMGEGRSNGGPSCDHQVDHSQSACAWLEVDEGLRRLQVGTEQS
ncbi:hypothetical protein CROQUDRAFT_322298 [Cronartium quercuum f. sp. fusiforme G11]|uniref:Uncharacterized protein n=1 Tax=Cronartium quercuum f. sp. fusiforme G11 TaxID=708437 RepID=A0A9P6N7Y7_9BASI|nr:hypothetical protein CROQUDRAFT_322298 [Cronartium quercuum f. sp. fusiforme G11]